MKLSKIIKYLDKKFPTSKALSWDPVGLQKFNKKSIDVEIEISNILLVMDLNIDSFEIIKNNNIQLIITRHPFIFNELNKEKENSFKKEMIKYLTKNNIIVYSIHTNYDVCGYKSFIDLLSKQIEFKKIQYTIFNKDYLKAQLKKEHKLIELIELMKKVFNTNLIQVSRKNDYDTKITDFYINQGSGASSMISNNLKDCTFITGEAKWSDWIYANDNNVNLITIGHYMENYFIDDMYERLSNNFKNIKITKVDIKEQYNVI